MNLPKVFPGVSVITFSLCSVVSVEAVARVVGTGSVETGEKELDTRCMH
jgi:hypothetical protein